MSGFFELNALEIYLTLLHSSVGFCFCGWLVFHPLDVPQLIHSPVIGTWVVSSLGLLWVMLLWIFPFRSWCRAVFSLLLNKYLEWEDCFIDQVYVYLYTKLTNCFSKWLYHFAFTPAMQYNVSFLTKTIHCRTKHKRMYFVPSAGAENYLCIKHCLLVRVLNLASGWAGCIIRFNEVQYCLCNSGKVTRTLQAYFTHVTCGDNAFSLLGDVVRIKWDKTHEAFNAEPGTT